MVGSFVKSATVKSLEAGVIGILADAALAGISTLEGVGVASDSTNGAPSGRAVCVGRIAGLMGSFGTPTARTPDSGELSDSWI